MSKLKENAKKAIKLAINDYSADETDREYSAIRNIYAGFVIDIKR
ncbi:hypothetical protein [Marispirochaeta sp.]|nr:hypothetical protein [Marispirochaeta sp.]